MRKYKNIFTCVILIITIGFVTYNIDSKRISRDKKPIFVVPTLVAKDGGSTVYRGLGYKVIRWNTISIRQVDGNEVQGFMTGYEISTMFNSQDINDGPKKDLKFVINE
ncbi:hypothetical protein [Clostridium intestinale]|uniref:Uncharacterized protein n=1 Tax=Clostridium intestinale DSM 6191 TaxID=1121320 RepID=A0A1M5W2J4_9CLOT|nr:hypothetical protein [Clostridium intestinale]SHH81715.1 hypothetical protein SAMN02745941_00896 [Clostridium intestinale DSM 6191]